MKTKKTLFRYTTGQLIAKLKEFPEDTPVLVTGYEEGYENILPPKKENLKHLPDSPNWSGQFDLAETNDKDTFEAILLEREVR